MAGDIAGGCKSIGQMRCLTASALQSMVAQEAPPLPPSSASPSMCGWGLGLPLRFTPTTIPHLHFKFDEVWALTTLSFHVRRRRICYNSAHPAPTVCVRWRRASLFPHRPDCRGYTLRLSYQCSHSTPTHHAFKTIRSPLKHHHQPRFAFQRGAYLTINIDEVRISPPAPTSMSTGSRSRCTQTKSRCVHQVIWMT